MQNESAITRLRRKAPWLSLIGDEPAWDQHRPDGSGRGNEPDAQTWGAPDNGSMEVRTGEMEGIAPPPLRPAMPIDRGPIAPTIDLPPISGIEQVQMGGRPMRSRMPGATEESYQDELTAYEPRKGISKKQAVLRAVTGFLDRGLPGAVNQTANYLLDPNAEERQWRDRELERSGQRREREGQRTRQGLNDRLLRARVTDAETPEVEKPKYDWLPGKDPNSEVYSPLTPGSVRPTKPASPHNPLIVEVKNPDGSTTRKQSDDYGKTWKPVEGLGDAPPPEKPDESEFSNAQIQASIQEAETEKANIWKARDSTPSTISTPGQYAGDPPHVVPNPEYVDLTRRGRELDDKVRDWRMRIKPGRPASPSTGAPKGRGFSIRAYLARNKGATEADAKAFAAEKYKGVPIVP